MHAGNDAVGRQHEIAARRRRHDGGVVDQTESAGMRRERPKIARDQALLGRFWESGIGAMHRLSA